jgi:hypothetical protein
MPLADCGDFSADAWMGGPYRLPRFCGECGGPFPWMETAVSTAKEDTEDLAQLNIDEKGELNRTIDDQTRDTPRTPLAAGRFKKLMSKIGPSAATVLNKVVETVATEAAKKMVGL